MRDRLTRVLATPLGMALGAGLGLAAIVAMLALDQPSDARVNVCSHGDLATCAAYPAPSPRAHQLDPIRAAQSNASSDARPLP